MRGTLAPTPSTLLGGRTAWPCDQGSALTACAPRQLATRHCRAAGGPHLPPERVERRPARLYRAISPRCVGAAPTSLSAVFDALSDRLQDALGDVRSRGKLTEDDINKAMRQVRLALLEADVNFKVVKQFTDAVKQRALGQDVLGSLNPGQQVVKIVSDELT